MNLRIKKLSRMLLMILTFLLILTGCAVNSSSGSADADFEAASVVSSGEVASYEDEADEETQEEEQDADEQSTDGQSADDQGVGGSVVTDADEQSGKQNSKQSSKQSDKQSGKQSSKQSNKTAGTTDGPTSTLGLSEDGTYTSKEEVAAYLFAYGHLPSNFITKNKAQDLGWDSQKGNLNDVAPGMSIGGDRFGNREGLLPKKKGRQYYECDIDYRGGRRNAKRIVFSDDGLIYYTEDHYSSFELLYGEE